MFETPLNPTKRGVIFYDGIKVMGLTGKMVRTALSPNRLVVVLYEPSSVPNDQVLANQIQSLVDNSGIILNYTSDDQQKFVDLETLIQELFGGSRDHPRCYFLVLEPSVHSPKAAKSALVDFLRRPKENQLYPVRLSTQQAMIDYLDKAKTESDPGKDSSPPGKAVAPSTKKKVLEFLNKDVAKAPRGAESRPKLVYLSSRPDDLDDPNFTIVHFPAYLSFEYVGSDEMPFKCNIHLKRNNIIVAKNYGAEGVIFFTSERPDGTLGNGDISYEVRDERIAAVFYDPTGAPDVIQMSQAIGGIIGMSGIYTADSSRLKVTLDIANDFIQSLSKLYNPTAPFAYLAVFESSFMSQKSESTKAQTSSSSKQQTGDTIQGSDSLDSSSGPLQLLATFAQKMDEEVGIARILNEIQRQ